VADGWDARLPGDWPPDELARLILAAPDPEGEE
jgi:hypothetical protein